MTKIPFVSKEKVEEIAAKYPTPFHLYDEKGIRKNVENLKKAFSWNKGYKEYFAVKATPNPFLINILREYGCGCDCSSKTELMMAKTIGAVGDDIMFSSNDTPLDEFRYCNKLGGIINLDDITHIEAVEKACGKLPKKISCRYNPGGIFKISNDIMDNPGDAKYGMTTEQIYEAFRILKEKALKNSAYTRFFAQIRLLMSIILCLQSFFLNLLPILKLSLVYILPLSTSQAVSEFLTNPIKSLMTFSLLVRV